MGDPLLWASSVVMILLFQQVTPSTDPVLKPFASDYRPGTPTQATIKLVTTVIYSILLTAVFGWSIRP